MKIFLITIIIASGATIIAHSSLIGREEGSVVVENPVVVAISETFDEPIIQEEEPALPESVTHVIPFTPQAPSAQWNDIVFQNACEEASIVMAAAWAKNEETLPGKSVIERDIRSISADAEKRFGENAYDTSAEDTATLFREYSRSEATILHDAASDDIADAVRKGNIVIAPFDGRKLGNPNYTAPGPEYHMLVIIGYDTKTGEFVTNDPGTRRGASYPYDEDILFDAIRDYRTGYHLKTTGAPGKTVIVVSRHTSSNNDQ